MLLVLKIKTRPKKTETKLEILAHMLMDSPVLFCAVGATWQIQLNDQIISRPKYDIQLSIPHFMEI